MPGCLGIPRDKTDQASALLTAARNTGGSIGVSLASNVLAFREQFHQSRLAELVIPSSISYQDTLQQVTHYFLVQGSSALQATQQAVAWIGQQVETQASLLAYIDVFWTLTLVSALAVPGGNSKIGRAGLARRLNAAGPSPTRHQAWSARYDGTLRLTGSRL